MKTIKIKYVGFWKNMCLEEFFLHQILTKYYDVQISDEPDYIICSCFDDYSYLDYPQVRILFSGENYIPDFNFVDYGLSVYPLSMLDRHYSFPGLVGAPDTFYVLKDKKRNYTCDILKEKTLFANSIFSHDSDNGLRSRLVTTLEQYRRVESPGPLQYNMPNGEKVERANGSKEALQRKTKFTLCCESTCQPGFITEKIFEAFMADTIPVYCGSHTITDIINQDAFIHITDCDDIQRAVDRIIQLDQDDDAYLEMLRQPIFKDADFIQKKLEGLDAFLCNIFDQPIGNAYRRPMSFNGAQHEKMLVSWRNTWRRFGFCQRVLDKLQYMLRK